MPAERQSSAKTQRFAIAFRGMPSRPVAGLDNGHIADTYGNPLGVECEACKRRALVPLDGLGQLDHNMRPLRNWPFKC